MSLETVTDKFFEEWKDKPTDVAFWAMLLAFAFVGLLGVMSNFRADSDIVFACQMYLFMLVMCGVVSALDNYIEFVKGKNVPWVSNVLAGQWSYHGLIPLVIGLAFGAILVGQKQSISIMQVSGVWAFAFVVFLAPVIEEWFFRWMMFPSFRQMFISQNFRYASIIALIASSFAFGAFHYYLYNQNILAMTSAVVLGILYVIGNYTLKSSTFSVGAHMANNYILFIAAGGLVFG